MQTPESVEAILARLVPPALSEAGQRGIEQMIDELAAEHPAVSPLGGRERLRRRSWWWVPGAAAALVAGLWLMHGHWRDGAVAPAQARSTGVETEDFVVVGGSGRIEEVTDEGWQEGRDGSAMHAMRLRVVEENRLLDQETGIVMSVRQPREEVVLMPVTAF